MMRLRRASVIAALLIIACAATARAECAWVLWNATVVPSLPDEGPVPVKAYLAMQECESALANEFAHLEHEGWAANYVQIRTIVATKGSGEKRSLMHYHCLPDTIDPRGPNG